MVNADDKSVVFDSEEGAGIRDTSSTSGASRTGTSQPIEPTNPSTAAGLAVDDPRNTSSSSSSSSESNKDVILYLPHPDNTFRYGQADEEVIVGREGKQFSRSEADRLLQLAEDNDVLLMERGLGELI